MTGPRQRAIDLLGVGLHSHGRDSDGWPVLAKRGAGARFEDSEGRSFIDWHMGFGAVLLGHGHPTVTAAIRAQLDSGTLFSVAHELEVQVAERLVATIPCAEKVAFGKNGSDACTAAVRIARAATGREGILQHGYHGFHDWCAVLKPGVRGLPKALAPLIYPLPFNNLPAIEAILRENGPQIAAVILEPMRDVAPDPGFLAGLQDLVEAAGALLIFDEMVTGFRRGAGGLQAEYGVTPDLACFGKALAQGLPLSVVVGKSHLIDLLSEVQYGMTARGESLALAAAMAVLDVLATEDVPGHVARIGEALGQGFLAVCARHGVEGERVGHPAMQGLRLPDALQEPFLAGCRARGVFTNGHFLPSLAHDHTIVAETLAVFDQVLAELDKPDRIVDPHPFGIADQAPSRGVPAL